VQSWSVVRRRQGRYRSSPLLFVPYIIGREAVVTVGSLNEFIFSLLSDGISPSLWMTSRSKRKRLRCARYAPHSRTHAVLLSSWPKLALLRRRSLPPRRRTCQLACATAPAIFSARARRSRMLQKAGYIFQSSSAPCDMFADDTTYVSLPRTQERRACIRASTRSSFSAKMSPRRM